MLYPKFSFQRLTDFYVLANQQILMLIYQNGGTRTKCFPQALQVSINYVTAPVYQLHNRLCSLIFVRITARSLSV